MRELAEMAYEFEEPFVLDTTKFQVHVRTASHPARRRHRRTVAWYQTRAHAMTTNRTPSITGSAGADAAELTRPRRGRAGPPRRRVHPGRLRRLLAGPRQPPIGGGAGTALIAVSAVAVVAVFAYGIRVTAGTGPGPPAPKRNASSGP